MTKTLTVTLGGKTISIDIPTVLSLRLARLFVIEQLMKQIKGPALTDALKAMGMK
jgi:hypothetical protein